MKLIIGLGNPGDKYSKNRHNVGHMFVDYMLQNGDKNDSKIKLMKTDGFMNQSGNFVQKQLNFFKLPSTNLIVVHDDLDIKLGQFKIQMASGPKQHNGVISVEDHLKTKDFWRIRIGVDNRSEDNQISGEDYVLSNFTEEEFKILNDEVFPFILRRI